jgi:hypothetical protein
MESNLVTLQAGALLSPPAAFLQFLLNDPSASSSLMEWHRASGPVRRATVRLGGSGTGCMRPAWTIQCRTRRRRTLSEQSSYEIPLDFNPLSQPPPPLCCDRHSLLLRPELQPANPANDDLLLPLQRLAVSDEIQPAERVKAEEEHHYVAEGQWMASLSACVRCACISFLLGGAQAALLIALSNDDDGGEVIAELVLSTCLCLAAIVVTWRLAISCPGYVGIPASPREAADHHSSSARSSSSSSPQFESFVFLRSADGGEGIEAVRGRRKACRTCCILRPVHCSHCRICNACVYRFDHHCSITDTCVGSLNIRRFVAFLWLTTAYCAVALIIAFRALFRFGIGESGSTFAALLAVILAGCINIVPLAAGSALYAYLYLWLGGVSLWAHSKKGGLYEGYELENEWARVPKPWSRGGFFRNLKYFVFSSP